MKMFLFNLRWFFGYSGLCPHCLLIENGGTDTWYMSYGEHIWGERTPDSKPEVVGVMYYCPYCKTVYSDFGDGLKREGN